MEGSRCQVRAPGGLLSNLAVQADASSLPSCGTGSGHAGRLPVERAGLPAVVPAIQSSRRSTVTLGDGWFWKE